MKKTLLSLVCLTIALAGCGRVSSPTPPEGSFYPHTYVIQSSEANHLPPELNEPSSRDGGMQQEVIIDNTTHIELIEP